MGMGLVPEFNLGRVVITQGARNVLGEIEIRTALMRHSCGDWGNVPDEDKRLNDEELASPDGYRVLSSYKSVSGERFWVITENIKRNPATTILLPEEY